jgi:hypothetical protein
MILVKTLQCNSCGGSLGKDNKCQYCGNRHEVIVKEDISRFKQGGVVAELLSFTVERVSGKVKFTPEHLKVNKVVGMVRVQSNKPMIESVGTFKHNGSVYILHDFFSPYNLQNTICDIPLLNNEYILEDISGFNFDGIKDEKLTVTLFPMYKPNKSRDISSYKPPKPPTC